MNGKWAWKSKLQLFLVQKPLSGWKKGKSSTVYSTFKMAFAMVTQRCRFRPEAEQLRQKIIHEKCSGESDMLMAQKRTVSSASRALDVI